MPRPGVELAASGARLRRAGPTDPSGCTSSEVLPSRDAWQGRLVRAAELGGRGARARPRTPAAQSPGTRRRAPRPSARRDPARRARGRRLRAPRRSPPRLLERPRPAAVDRPRRVAAHRPGRHGCSSRSPRRLATAAPCAQRAASLAASACGRSGGSAAAGAEPSGPPCCSRTSPDCWRPAMRPARARDCRRRRSPRPSPAQVVEHDILLSWLGDLEGRHADSRRLLMAALEAAESEGLVHPFLSAGPAHRGAPPRTSRSARRFPRAVLDHFTPALRRTRSSSSSRSPRASSNCSRTSQPADEFGAGSSLLRLREHRQDAHGAHLQKAGCFGSGCRDRARSRARPARVRRYRPRGMTRRLAQSGYSAAHEQLVG